ncbi:SHOCT domain-containing protein [Romboutsia lituseburensis]|uniref:SHOCT domain-containing protein n=1 Tax=Romboutsia lituseburensis TaxID=1537 RepID=UPI0022EB20B0|nr:SHOCT domain-containing protein [Romboutsia lituseburensis]
MGLFSKKETCSICKKEQTKIKLSDGNICGSCLRESGLFPITKPVKNYTIEDIHSFISSNNKNKEYVENFNVTKKIGTYIEFDDKNKQWLIPDGFNGKKKNPKIYSYKDIIEFELLEDGDTVSKGGLGRAIAGGVLLGGVGAVVGGVTGKRKTKSVVNSLKIKITLDDINVPNRYIDLIKVKTKTSSLIYKTSYKLAQEIISTLAVIVENNEKNSTENNITYSAADEIIKFKNLLDNGIITQNEFDIKKKELLGI